MAIINLLVEGEIDEAVGRKLVLATGHDLGVTYGKKGYEYIRNKIAGFNQSAVEVCYLALADFADSGFVCPGEGVSTLLPNRRARMLFRLVVPEIESWLLADREGMADFLRVNIRKLPQNPEILTDPKQSLVNFARRSRSRSVIQSLVPEQGSTATVGRLYNADLADFVTNRWDFCRARNNSNSLDRCIERLLEI